MPGYVQEGDTITFCDSHKRYYKLPTDDVLIIDKIPYIVCTDHVLFHVSKQEMMSFKRSYTDFRAYVECLRSENAINPETAERMWNMMNNFYRFTQIPE